MRRRWGWLAATAALTLSCAHTGVLKDESALLTTDSATESAPAFAIRAARMNASTIELSKVAFVRAFDAQVKPYAKTEIADHLRLNGALDALAKQRGWDLPDVADHDHRMLEDDIAHVTGPDVDALYMRGMVADHVEAVSFFQRYVRTGDDPDLVAWARGALTVLAKHQDLAEQTNAWVQPTSR